MRVWSDDTYHRDKLSVKRVTIAVNGDGQERWSTGDDDTDRILCTG